MRDEDVFRSVTEQVMQAMRAGTTPWRRPWGAGGQVLLPLNARTRRPYRGVNAVSLWAAGYDSPYWATAKTWAGLGASVLPNQAPAEVHFCTFFQGRGDKRVPYRNRYSVYNFRQVTGCRRDLAPGKPAGGFAPVDRLVRASQAVVVEGATAYYDQEEDRIILPPRELFHTEAGYQTTRLHELSHWTGHHSRLRRTFGRDRRSKEYAFEELVAELAACFLAASLGVPQALDELPSHADYLSQWLEILGEDCHAMSRAAAAAQRAAEYLLQKGVKKCSTSKQTC